MGGASATGLLALSVAYRPVLSSELAGDIIRGSGGIRKIRWRSKGRGKRGGSRVIYYWLVSEEHIYLLTLYGKGVKDDLTPAERAAWRKVVEEIANG